MGYRSEVAIKIYGKERAMDAVNDFYQIKYAELSAEGKSDVDFFMSEDYKNGFNDRGKSFRFHVDSVKWYEDYEFVKFYTSIMAEAVKLGVSVEFIRIGEDSDDIEEMFLGDDNDYTMDIVRSIDGI
jgi:hypothetical protein